MCLQNFLTTPLTYVECQHTEMGAGQNNRSSHIRKVVQVIFTVMYSKQHCHGYYIMFYSALYVGCQGRYSAPSHIFCASYTHILTEPKNTVISEQWTEADLYVDSTVKVQTMLKSHPQNPVWLCKISGSPVAQQLREQVSDSRKSLQLYSGLCTGSQFITSTPQSVITVGLLLYFIPLRFESTCDIKFSHHC